MQTRTNTPDDAPRRRDFGRIFRRAGSRKLWVRYKVGGKTYEESARSTSQREAERLLARRQAEFDLGAFTPPSAKRTRFEDLEEIVRNDYRVQQRRSIDRLETSLVHLRAAFGGMPALAITRARLDQYVVDRFAAGAAASTVRNELNALGRAFRLAEEAGKVLRVPPFPSIAVTNIRVGFFEPHELDAILAELPAEVRPVVTFMAWTGWRRGEVLSREWRHVDLKAGVIRLEPGETKNGKARDFPFTLIPELKALIDEQRAATAAVERRTGQEVPWVFHREGRGMKSFRTAWRAASRRAKLALDAALQGTTPRALWKQMTREQRRQFKGLDRIPHDFRRTAVRNLVRAGVSEKVAMELTGHLTRSVFERYNITTDRDRRDAVVKLAAFVGGPTRGTVGGQSPVSAGRDQ